MPTIAIIAATPSKDRLRSSLLTTSRNRGGLSSDTTGTVKFLAPIGNSINEATHSTTKAPIKLVWRLVCWTSQPLKGTNTTQPNDPQTRILPKPVCRAFETVNAIESESGKILEVNSARNIVAIATPQKSVCWLIQSRLKAFNTTNICNATRGLRQWALRCAQNGAAMRVIDAPMEVTVPICVPLNPWWT